MTREQRRTDLLVFLGTIQRPDCSRDQLSDDENLVDAGLIDSLAMLEIVQYLENTYGLDLADRGIEPEEITSIRGILDLVERELG